MFGWGTVVVVVADGQLLLTRRQDFGVWCLPGGAIEPDEFVADAAVREAREETGLEVELTALLGIYFRPTTLSGATGHVVAFTARHVGGSLQPQPSEVLEARFFDFDQLPTPLVRLNLRIIDDAASRVGGSALWLQDMAWPFGPSVQGRQALYDLRDRSGLTPPDFYARYLDDLGPAGERRIV